MVRKKSFGQDHQSVVDGLIKKLRFNQIKNLIASKSTVVDLGCGYRGDLLQFLAKQDHRGIGLDLLVSKEQHDNFILKKANLDKRFPLKDGVADYVFSLAVIEHVTKPDNLLKEARRILKKGGLLVLTTPSIKAKGILEFLAYKLKVISSIEIADHKRYYNQESLKEALLKAGFQEKDINIKSFQLGFNMIARCKK